MGKERQQDRGDLATTAREQAFLVSSLVGFTCGAFEIQFTQLSFQQVCRASKLKAIKNWRWVPT